MCKRLLLSALAVAFSAGAILGVAGPADWGWSGPGADSGTVQADWSWDAVTADPAGHHAKAGAGA
ncbi:MULTISPECIES: hypothetical protein [Streptomyces]|uniref:Uncharacterized protein n=1 Tax=Streptomyces chilikensis TaxID=1194079 RepID=A0ABV3ESL1_9ACTN|nr:MULTISPECIES: hypothetical protein [Streptomyces]MDH6225874.1 hypothetical protein [Streptomyces sp. MJP52]